MLKKSNPNRAFPFLAFSLMAAASLLPTITFAAAEEADLSLEDIMNLHIVTASKKSESLFDSPLSSSVLTREQMQNAGVTSIQEAFRQIPGVFVREQTNGNFSITLRGLGDLPRGDFWPAQTNAVTLLVMIDNRAVYNYFQGSTFWETLPIGLNDIEQIEVVRGPTSALYGPNAVSGVINIITRRPQKEGLSTWGSLAAGNATTGLGSASLSYKDHNLWSETVSFNYDRRSRFSNQYYDFAQQQYVSSPDLITGNGFNGLPVFTNPSERYPEPSKALEQFGLNSFSTYKPTEHISLDLEGGYQASRAQNIYNENGGTPLAMRDSHTGYVDLKGKFDKLSTHFAYMWGKQSALGINALPLTNTLTPAGTGPLATAGVPYFIGSNPTYGSQTLYDFNFDLSQFDGEIEYDWTLGNLSLRPGIVGRKAIYNGSYIGGVRQLNNVGLSLRTEYKLNDWRFVGALRADKYDYPARPYQSWQLAVTKTVGDNQLFRAAYSRSNKQPAMSDAFLSLSGPAPSYNATASAAFGAPVWIVVTPKYQGNSELELLSADMYELGHRIKIMDNKLQLDTELFWVDAHHFPGVSNPSIADIVTGAGAFTIVDTGDARQLGATSALSLAVANNVFTRFYATLQNATFTYLNGTTVKNDANPLLYGGLDVNYKPALRWNVNLNPYFYTATTNRARDQQVGTADVVMGSKLIMNARVSYEFIKGATAFVNARNLLNDTKNEFSYGDPISGLYMLGFNADF